MKTTVPCLAVSTSLLFTCLFLLSCTSVPVKGYKGPDLPPDKIAIIEPHTYITLVACDGEKVPSSSSSIAVAPGLHTVEVSTEGFDGNTIWESPTSHLYMEFNAEEGHAYFVRYDKVNFGVWSAYITDKKSGERVRVRYVVAPSWALSSLEAAIQRVPNDANAWRKKTFVLMELKRYDEALQASDTALRLKPDDGYVWNIRGLVFLRTHRYEKALKAFEKTIELEPRESISWFNKGLTLELMEKYEEALQAYDKSLELDPNDTDAQNRKAGILKRLSGKRDVARAHTQEPSSDNLTRCRLAVFL